MSTRSGCLALEVGHSLTSADAVRTLNRLIAERGEPGTCAPRADRSSSPKRSGSTFKEQGAKPRHIDPGAPWQNPYVESFNGKLRDELLCRELFDNLLEAQVYLLSSTATMYNRERPHSALGYQSPAAFAAACTSNPTHRINPEPTRL